MTARTSAGPAGSRRFWITVLIFALANGGAWLGYDRLQRHRGRLLEVTQFLPGDGAVVDERPTLTWTFNLDVAASATGVVPVQLSPGVLGKWRWPDRRTLSFTPDAPLPRATQFSAKIPADALRTSDGFRLSRESSFTFHTAPPELVEVRQAAVDNQDRVILELRFTDKMLPADVRQHLAILGPRHEAIQFEPHGNAAGNTIRFITQSLSTGLSHPEEAFLDVKVSKGLAGASGPMGLEQDEQRRVTVAADVLATQAFGYSPANGQPTVALRFNNEVDSAALRDLISTEPPVPVTITSDYDGATLHGAFEPGVRYAIKIAKAPVGSIGKRLPRPATLSVLVPDRSPGIWFEHEEGYLSAAGNREVLAHAVNYSDLRVRVTRVYDNNLVVWRTGERQRRATGPQSFGRPIATRDYHLPGEKNKTRDLRLSLDDLLPADRLNDGVYQIELRALRPGTKATHRLEAEENDGAGYEAQAATLVTLSDIGLSAKTAKEGVTVWATSLRTARPLSAVRVRLYSNKNQLLGEARTDAEGLAKVAGFTPAPGEQPAVVIADILGEPVSDPSSPLPALRESGKSGKEAGDEIVRPLAPAGRENDALPRGLTWLDLTTSALSTSDLDLGGRAYLRQGFEALVYTDRGIYRPGETVHLRAIIRGVDQTVPPAFPVRWQLRRPDLRDWKAEVCPIDADGAAAMELHLPHDLPTGRWTADIGLPSDDKRAEKVFGSASFLVEEFMPQRIKVAVKIGGSPEPARLQAGDQPLPIDVQAIYLFGRPADGRPASVVARLDPAVFHPQAFNGWTFGDAAETAAALGTGPALGRRMELPGVDLNEKGQAHWDVNLDELLEKGTVGGEARKPSPSHSRRRAKEAAAQPQANPEQYPGPWKLTVSASVTETGGRAVTATQQADVDRAPYYVGVHLRDSAPRPGSACAYDVRLVTPSGKIAATDVTLQATLYKESWNSSYVFEDNHYRYRSTRVLEPLSKTPTDVTMQAGVGEGTFTLPQGGAYVLVLRDEQTGGVASCRISCWYGSWEDNVSRENPERLELIVQPTPPADPTELLDAAGRLDFEAVATAIEQVTQQELDYRPDRVRVGRSAQVVVRSPFAGRLLLSIETDRVVFTRVIEMTASHLVVPIDVTDACRPNAYISATVIRAIDPNGKWRPHRAFGAVRMAVDDADRRLNVALTAPLEIRPQQSLHADFRITDDSGAAVSGAAVTVAAVDEGICLLTNFQTPDPLKFFTTSRALDVKWADLFGELMPEVEKPSGASAIGGDETATMSHHSPVSARRVRPVALVSAVLHTDADGIAHADFSVPQFTGQLRLMAVASAASRFGSGQAPVLVRSPLLVQSSWPRFAAPGDRFSVPLVVFNNGLETGDATITIKLTGAQLRFAKNGERTMTLPPMLLQAGAQASAVFDIIAQDEAGVAHARLLAKMNDQTYEEEIELPVRPASPAIALGGYSIARPDAPAVIAASDGMLGGTGRFEIRVSPQPQLQIPEGLDYLDRYPYGCLEQTTSTLFPLVYLPDIGKHVAPGMFDRERVADKVRVGILRMMSMQTADGGLAMWPGGTEDWPWGTVYAAHFLVEAQSAGYEVPAEFFDQTLAYLRALLNRPEATEDTLETQAYAAYVLAQAGKPQRSAMAHLNERLLASPANPGRFHLALAWLASGRRDLAQGLIPLALPEPRVTRQLTGALGSPTRDRALLAMALLAAEPNHPAIPDLIQRLARDGAQHQWRSTQDVAFAVMAVGRYLRQATTPAPYDSVELLVNGASVATAGAGQSLNWLAPPDLDLNRAKIEVRAAGVKDSVAHVAWLQTGVPLKPPVASDAGLQLRRRYLDEHGQPLEGKPLHSGDLVQVELTLTGSESLHHVVVEDLLPAGLEIENPRLENNAADRPVRGAKRSSEEEPAFGAARVDMRDDRIILVGYLRAAGHGTYVYTARAVAPGRFIVPPAKAECMYDLGVSSLCAGGTLDVLSNDSTPLAGAQARAASSGALLPPLDFDKLHSGLTSMSSGESNLSVEDSRIVFRARAGELARGGF